MAAKYKAHSCHFDRLYFQPVPTHIKCIGGSVVECSPAIENMSRPRAARVRFPADAVLFHIDDSSDNDDYAGFRLPRSSAVREDERKRKRKRRRKWRMNMREKMRRGRGSVGFSQWDSVSRIQSVRFSQS